MPIPQLRSFAKQSGKSLDDVERYYKDAKKQAEKQGQDDNYSYIIGIVKKRCGLESSNEDWTVNSLSRKLNNLIDTAVQNLLPKPRFDSMDELRVDLEVKNDEFTKFVKRYLRKNPGKTHADATNAYYKKRGKNE